MTRCFQGWPSFRQISRYICFSNGIRLNIMTYARNLPKARPPLETPPENETWSVSTFFAKMKVCLETLFLETLHFWKRFFLFPETLFSWILMFPETLFPFIFVFPETLLFLFLCFRKHFFIFFSVSRYNFCFLRSTNDILLRVETHNRILLVTNCLRLNNVVWKWKF